MASVSTPEFWTDLYARGDDGWELGQPAPPLVDFVERTPPRPGRVAVPGCGRGHDVRYLAAQGYRVTGFDFSLAAIAAARALARAAGVPAEFEERDIFSLEREYAYAFDGVWEYTCFCAIAPERRAAYVRAIAAILRPGGWYLACFFPMRRRAAGPPFAVSRAEVRRLFGATFRLERAFPPVRSVRARQGQEWMVLARRSA